RSIRELHVYCEIVPYNSQVNHGPEVKGIILSGSPCSVLDNGFPNPNLIELAKKAPLLGVCYGAQLLAAQHGGEVGKSAHREYGRSHLLEVAEDPLLTLVEDDSQVWMSHSDTIKQLPEGFEVIARTRNIPIAAFKAGADFAPHPVYGIQFHPEVTHSTDGRQLLKNFVLDICKAQPLWTPSAFIEDTVQSLKDRLGDARVVMALSGGVDSTVAASLIHRAIGDKLFCIFVDNGLLRKGEFEQVLEGYEHLGFNTIGIDARDLFYEALAGVTDPETK